LRRDLLALRRGVDKETLRTASDAIAGHVTRLAALQAPGCMLGYHPMADEVDILPCFTAAMADGRQTGLAAMDSRGATPTLTPVAWQPGEPLERAALGVWQPPQATWRPIPLEEISLVLVPGLGFDRAGGRLGFGKGYYDRFLARLRALPTPPLLAGVGLQRQLLRHVPMEPWDIHLDGVVTEEGWRPAQQ